jgi:hypothetical protein
MIEQIKQIVKNVLDNEKLTEYTSGTVSSISPLKIKVNQKLELPESVLLLTFPVKELKINLSHDHQYPNELPTSTTKIEVPKDTDYTDFSEVVIVEGLKVGDKVTMLRVEKGQKYIVLSKVV